MNQYLKEIKQKAIQNDNLNTTTSSLRDIVDAEAISKHTRIDCHANSMNLPAMTEEENYHLVSIIMPLYNYEQYVIEAIQSVINQTYKNWELIIVDDGSTDNSYNVVKIFLNTLPIDIKNKIQLYQNEKNFGKSKSVNFAATKIKGEYMFIFDADDILIDIFLEDFIYTFKNNNVDIVTCFEEVFGTNKNIVTPDGSMFKYSLFRSVIWRIMCETTAFHKVGGYLETIKSMVDYEFSVRLLLSGFDKAITINKVLYLYRRHNYSLVDHQTENQTYYKAKMVLNLKEHYNKYYVMWAEEVLKGNEDCKKLDNKLHRMPDFINLLVYFEKDNLDFIKREIATKHVPLLDKQVFYTKIPLNMPDGSVIDMEYLLDYGISIGHK